MRRLVASVSILFLWFSLNIVCAGAANKPTKSLHQATIDGDIEQVRLNISTGADVNAKDNMGYTPLLYAAKDGKEEVAELLIAGGADVNVKDQLGNTPLHYAAVSGHYNMCRLLLDEEADANAKNLMDGTPLAMARAGHHDKIVELLSSKVDNEIGTKPAEVSKEAELLHQAAMVGDVNQVKSLISKGVDVNAKNRLGWTPLHNALWYGHKAIVELLIDKGSNVNAKETGGNTPLHFVAIKGGREAAELLIAKGADVNAKNVTQQTSLLLAASYGHKDLVELLIEKGADVNAQSGSDNALSMARKKSYVEIEELLLKHGAKEPTLDLMEDRLYGPESEGVGLYPGRGMQAERGSSRAIASRAMVDVLADPNEIKARIKTFEGLEKALEELNSKSRLEKAAWLQRKYDNRTSLNRAIKEQFKQELTFIRKIAVEEKAERTTKTIDDVLSGKEKLDSEIYKELLAQKREMKQAEGQIGRSRGGYQGRSTRGRYSQGRTSRGPQPGEDMAGTYAERGRTLPRMDGLAGEGQVPQEVDTETENKIREWLQTTPENKTNLLRSVHTEIQTEYISIREAAVEEGAKKTTAAIDGVLLSRQEQYDDITMRMGAEKIGLPGQRDRYLPGQRYPQDRRMGEQIPGENLRGQELNYLEQENRRVRR